MQIDLTDSSTVVKRSRGLFYGWVIVAVGFCIASTVYGAVLSFGVFLNPLREAFGWTSAAVSGAYSLAMFLYGSFGILAGWGVDKYGPKRMLMLGGILLGSGLILTSRVNSLWQLYATYGVIGMGESCIYVPLMATVSRWFTRRRGLALGIISVGMGSGPLIMAPLASYLIIAFDWRFAYLIIGLTAVIIIIAALFMKKSPQEIGGLPDGAVGDVAISPETGVSKVATEVSGFSLIEAARNRAFWLIASMFLTVGMGVQMVMAHVVAYGEGTGLSPFTAATVLSTISGASIAGRLTMGMASDWIGTKRALAICVVVEGVMIFYLTGASSAWMFFLFGAIFGFFYGGHSPQFPGLTADTLGVGHLGAILGATALFWGAGGALGPVLAGYVVDTTGSYSIAFIIGGMVMFLTAAASLLVKRPEKRRGKISGGYIATATKL